MSMYFVQNFSWGSSRNFVNNSFLNFPWFVFRFLKRCIMELVQRFFFFKLLLQFLQAFYRHFFFSRIATKVCVSISSKVSEEIPPWTLSKFQPEIWLRDCSIVLEISQKNSLRHFFKGFSRNSSKMSPYNANPGKIFHKDSEVLSEIPQEICYKNSVIFLRTLSEIFVRISAWNN